MVFSSVTFLFVFLPLLLVIYSITPDKIKNYILLAFSMLFYAWGEPKYIILLIGICFINYLGGIFISRVPDKRLKNIILYVTVLTDLLTLGYYKYTDFLISNYNRFLGGDITTWNIIMPIGISFFIFQSISYAVDVYRSDVKPQNNFFKLFLYISFFPQLIAGPIVKYHDVAGYLEEREYSWSNIAEGLGRFCIGLAKKVLIANSLGETADAIFTVGSSNISVSVAWLGAIAYSFQLYYDFSGYSDMAIGLGRIFGFKFMENFNYPYISTSISEFWRRWHISLSTWFKEYVYIPLGGSRYSLVRTCLNLAVVFLVTGIWHGAAWTFIAWGIYHGFFVIMEKFLRVKEWNPKYNWLYHIYAIMIVIFGWVIFRSDNLGEAVCYIFTMLGIGQHNAEYILDFYFNGKVAVMMGIAILGSMPWTKMITSEKLISVWHGGIKYIYFLAVLFLSLVYVASSTYNPFIYFRF